MKRIQRNRTAAQRADESRRRHPSLAVLILCLAMTAATAISTAAVGGSLSRFTQEESNVIPLVPQTEQLSATVEKDTSHAGTDEEPKRSEGPEEASATTAPRRAAEENNNTQAAKFQGELQIHEAVQHWSWNSETQVDLFKESYSNESGSETVKAEDGNKVFAPGTSNKYDFTLENNSNYSLDYTISMKVETESDSSIPLKWRLLDGDGTAVSDWQGYSAAAELMQEDTLDVRRQDNYSIEWCWDFEQGEDMDGADTKLGDLAASQPQNAKATIVVHAEQNAEQSTEPGSGGQTGASGLHMWPKTGDTSNLIMYIILMAVSGCGLLILFPRERQRKKR